MLAYCETRCTWDKIMENEEMVKGQGRQEKKESTFSSTGNQLCPKPDVPEIELFWRKLVHGIRG